MFLECFGGRFDFEGKDLHEARGGLAVIQVLQIAIAAKRFLAYFAFYAGLL
jgi:hypothetical protein